MAVSRRVFIINASEKWYDVNQEVTFFAVNRELNIVFSSRFVEFLSFLFFLDRQHLRLLPLQRSRKVIMMGKRV